MKQNFLYNFIVYSAAFLMTVLPNTSLGKEHYKGDDNCVKIRGRLFCTQNGEKNYQGRTGNGGKFGNYKIHSTGEKIVYCKRGNTGRAESKTSKITIDGLCNNN